MPSRKESDKSSEKVKKSAKASSMDGSTNIVAV